MGNSGERGVLFSIKLGSESYSAVGCVPCLVLLDTMEEALACREAEEQGEITVALEEDRVESLETAKRILVGKILSGRLLNRGAVKNILSKAWGEPNGLQIADLGPNIYMFTFKEKKDAVEVMKKGPWFVMNHLLSLQYWVPEASVHEIDFSKVSFWVQIHNMSLGTMNTKNAVKIMEKVGEVVEVEDPRVDGVLLRTFIRVRVYVDVLKPLPTGCWVPRLDLPKIWVVFKYERLQDVCFRCGIIGHEQKWCDREKVVTVANSNNPKYGPFLSAPPAKSLAEIVSAQGRWRMVNKQKSASQEEAAVDEGPQAQTGRCKDDVTFQKEKEVCRAVGVHQEPDMSRKSGVTGIHSDVNAYFTSKGG